jgi:type III secretion protein J
MKRWTILMGLAAALLLLSGCSEPIYHGLDERDANEMVVVLEQQGIDASKRRDPAADDAWIIEVPPAQSGEAWRILQKEGLPRREVSGFDQFYPSGGLVPTENEERVLLQFSTAQELTRSLLKIDGVVDAQVNLVLPEKPKVQLESTVIEPPRASVLVKYKAESQKPPVSREEVARLVSGGVEGLEQKRVDVIFTRAERSAQPLAKSKVSSIGPIAVAPESETAFQILIGIMGLCIVGLSGAVVFMVLRIRRMQTSGEANG